MTWALSARRVYTHFPTEQKTSEVTVEAAVSSVGITYILFVFSKDLSVRIFFLGKKMEDESLILLPLLNPGQSLTWDKLVEIH